MASAISKLVVHGGALVIFFGWVMGRTCGELDEIELTPMGVKLDGSRRGGSLCCGEPWHPGVYHTAWFVSTEPNATSYASTTLCLRYAFIGDHFIKRAEVLMGCLSGDVAVSLRREIDVAKATMIASRNGGLEAGSA